MRLWGKHPLVRVQTRFMGNRAIILGALGQDGSYMTELLESKGWDVYGVVREDTKMDRFTRAKTVAANLLNKDVLRRVLNNIKPQVIYNFAGVSNVFNPYENGSGLMDLNARLPHNILEAISQTDKSIRFFQSSSCLIFGKDTSGFQNEETPPNPIYPYGASKLYADYLVKMYREQFGIFACSGIFFNHESPRRGEYFFSRRITTAAKNKEKIKVGNLSAVRDYGYAPDFMEAVYFMMNADEPKDYVIGTGNLISMRDFAEKAFSFAGLNYQDFVETEEAMIRNQDTNILRADISKIKKDLGWTPKTSIDGLIKSMMQ